MGGRPWTKEEERLLTYWIPRIGFQGTQQKLEEQSFHRTYYAIENRARYLGLSLGRPKSYWSLWEFTHSGYGYQLAKRKASEAGVLEKFAEASTKAPFCVPEWWALEYMRQQAEKHEMERSDWWTTRQVANHLALDENFVRNQFRRGTRIYRELNTLIRTIERRRGFGRKWFYNPTDVKRVKNELRDLAYGGKRAA